LAALLSTVANLSRETKVVQQKCGYQACIRKKTVRHSKPKSGKNEHATFLQARNQLGTPGGAKSFLRDPKYFKLCPTHFSRRGEKFCRKGEASLRFPLVTGLHFPISK